MFKVQFRVSHPEVRMGQPEDGMGKAGVWMSDTQDRMFNPQDGMSNLEDGTRNPEDLASKMAVCVFGSLDCMPICSRHLRCIPEAVPCGQPLIFP
jgi:hypothetical protein